jgi:hypothetical protein
VDDDDKPLIDDAIGFDLANSMEVNEESRFDDLVDLSGPAGPA